MHYAYMMSMLKHEEPTCFEEENGKHVWDKAMDEKMDSLSHNKTWGSTTNKWKECYRLKMGLQGEI